uniref:Uncharacterized protein n=1 Tax=Cacopsylla melanoneura TaxID=428564 RepID=A0A8D8QU78_9HEMI
MFQYYTYCPHLVPISLGFYGFVNKKWCNFVKIQCLSVKSQRCQGSFPITNPQYNKIFYFVVLIFYYSWSSEFAISYFHYNNIILLPRRMLVPLYLLLYRVFTF